MYLSDTIALLVLTTIFQNESIARNKIKNANKYEDKK